MDFAPDLMSGDISLKFVLFNDIIQAKAFEELQGAPNNAKITVFDIGYAGLRFGSNTTETRSIFFQLSSRIRVDLLLFDSITTDKQEQYD